MAFGFLRQVSALLAGTVVGTTGFSPLRPLTGPARNDVHRWKAAVPDLPGS